MRVLRWLGIGLVAIVGLLLVAAVAARLSDGPFGIMAGGPLVAGELVAERDIDFAFAADVQTIEFQLLEPPRSRTVWVVVHDGAAYVPCGFLSLPLWKQWPHEAMEDGRALLRINGKRYERLAVRVTDMDTYRQVTSLVARKYGLGDAGEPDPEAVWIFRMDPRPQA